MQNTIQQSESGASLPPGNGSALQSLVISQDAADKERARFHIAREMVKAITGEQVDTLAGWWCVFNAREWPDDLGVQKPMEDRWAASFGMKLIESLLDRNARKLLKLAWRCYMDERADEC